MGGRRQVPVTGVAAIILRRLRELHFAGQVAEVARQESDGPGAEGAECYDSPVSDPQRHRFRG